MADVRPTSVAQLRAAVQALAAGDYSMPAPVITSGDELAELANDLRLLVANLRDLAFDLRARAALEHQLLAEANRQGGLAAAVMNSIQEGIVFVDPDASTTWIN